MIDIGVDIIHLEPVVVVAFPTATVVRTLAQHGEAIRGIQEHLLGVPIQKELKALRFRAVEKVTCNHERLARIGIEQQLAAVQESHRQDQEDFRKLKKFVTSQFVQRS
ncbi:hypothetical protein Tco_0608438 [Tanacetum coccineum]